MSNAALSGRGLALLALGRCSVKFDASIFSIASILAYWYDLVRPLKKPPEGSSA